MEGILNGTLTEDVFNASSTFDSHHVHKSNLGRWLFSYDQVNKVYTPILFLFGLVGNMLSVWVFCMAPSHRHLSSSYYLSALAISDTGFLINLLAVWLEDLGYHVITTQLTCPLVMYLGQVTCFLSVWLTVSFTVERFFAVCYPLTRPTVCTVARAKKVISILTLVALLAFSYVWLIARALDWTLPGTSSPDQSAGRGWEGNRTGTVGEEWFLREAVGEDGRRREDREGSDGDNSSTRALLPACPSFLTAWKDKEGDKDFLPPSFSFLCNRSHPPAGPGGGWNATAEEVGGEEGGGGQTIRVCYVREEHIYVSSIASHIDSLLTLILPFFVITYLNVRIALCVWKLKDQRQNIMAVAKISSSASNLQFHQTRSEPLSPACRLPMSGSSPLLNGIFVAGGAAGGGAAHTPTSFSQANRMNRMNVGSSSGSLNTVNSVSASGGTRAPARHHPASTSAAEARVTKTLLLVSTVFLVLNLPAHAIRAVVYVQSLWGSEMVEELQAAQQWANILFNTNFSVNFLLYCVSGRNFRKSLWTVMFKSRRSRGRPTKQSCKRSTSQLQQLHLQTQPQMSVSNRSHLKEEIGEVGRGRVNGANNCQILVQTSQD